MSKIGFAEVKITPKVTVPMGGYAPTRSSTGVHDDLYARAMYFSDGKNEVLIIAVEVVCIFLRFVRRMRRLISKKTGVNQEHILISSHHNHSGPDTLGLFDLKGFFKPTYNMEMMVEIEKKVVKSAILARKNAEKGRIGLGKGDVKKRVILNRRDPQKGTKYDLSVIRIDSVEGKIRGLIINYACHATSLPRENTLLTGEYPGYIVRKIKKETNNSIFSMYTNGACGDINPNLYPEDEPFELITKERISKHSYREFNQLGNYKKTIAIGSCIADSALEIVNSVETSEIKEIKVLTKIIEIPLHDMIGKSAMQHVSFKLRKHLITGLLNYNHSNISYVSFTKKKKDWYFQTELQIIKINDIIILSIPGELFVELGKKLISASPSEKTFLIELGNDWVGYLYPPKEYFLGGYETGIVSFSPVAGIYIYNKMLNLLKRI